MLSSVKWGEITMLELLFILMLFFSGPTLSKLSRTKSKHWKGDKYLDGLSHGKINRDAQERNDSPISLEEIEIAIKSLPSVKSLRQDSVFC